MNVDEQLHAFLNRECPESESARPFEENHDDTTPEELEVFIQEINGEVKKAEEHVKIHTAQREEAKKWIETAKQDEVAKKPLKEKNITLTMDMSQNGTVPSLSGE